MRDVKLSRIVTVLEELDYPLTREAVREECGDVTILLADGQVSMGELLSSSETAVYESMDELLADLMSILPRRAVGEPGQSEGDA